jgi:SOS-response transcriptional repressor LexA
MSATHDDSVRKGIISRDKILTALKLSEMSGHFMSVREIGEAVGLSSSSTVHNHLRTLKREGKITMSYQNSRSFRYVKASYEICGCCGGSGFASNRFRGILEPEIPGTELIGDTRSPEETSFGH